MIDMSSVIVAKSDQINAADLIGISRTVKIVGVKLTGKEQATEIRIADDDKVWRPNKNTVRIMSRAWGNDGEKWIGRSATLFCDPKVRFGKDEPGGIRISHLSGLRDKLTICLQERKGVLKTYQIEPLSVAQPRQIAKADDAAPFTRADGQEGYDIGGHDPETGEVDDGPDRRLMVVKRIVDAIAAAETVDDLSAIGKAERLTVRSMPEEMQADIAAAEMARRVDLAGGE